MDAPGESSPARFATPSMALYGVNKFLASGRSTNSDWGRAPARLNPTIEERILDSRRISALLDLFQAQPWFQFGHNSGPSAADAWQREALRACEFAMRNTDLTQFPVLVEGKEVANYLAVGPGRTILVCWEGAWRDRWGNEHNEIMYQVVVPYLDGLSKSEVLREFLSKFGATSGQRVNLQDWDASNSKLFRQACKAIWSTFPDLSTPEAVISTLIDEATCTICLDDLEQGSKYQMLSDIEESEETMGVRTSCGHYFHAGCIEAWLACKSDCPVCRRNPWNTL